MQLSEIFIGERFRKDLGSLDYLQTSITELGLLHPILIQAGSNKLIDGFRRIKALEALNYTDLPEDWVRTVQMAEILRGEFDANVIRKAFLPSEIAEIASALEAEIKERYRQKSIDAGAFGEEGGQFGTLGGRGNKTGGEKYEEAKKTLNTMNPTMSSSESYDGSDETEDSEDFTDQDETQQTPQEGDEQAAPNMHKTRQELTEKLGYSHGTLAKIMEIKKAAVAEPKVYGQLLEKMDEDRKIDPAYQQFQRIKSGLERKHYGMSDELLALRSDQKGRQIADFVVKAFCFLPEVKQAGLIKKYGDYCFLVKQSNYDRGIKGFSPIKSTDAATLDETALTEALDDILAQTKEEYEKWVYYEQITNVACTLYNVIESKGRITSTIEKLEFFAIGLGLFTGGFLKYMQLASREKLIDTDFPEELAGATGEIFKQIVLLHQNGIITRLAVKRKKDLGGLEGIEEKQDLLHSAKISEAMIENEAELLHYIKQLSGVIGEKAAKVAEKIAEME